MSDRILVMREGRVGGEFERQEATEEKILTCALGGATYAVDASSGAHVS
jgi:D-xylose transport system ATP-binding protein